MTETARQKQRETPSQARNWERIKNLYLANGLCHRCASQAAYGHQLGYTSLQREPCPTCRPKVDKFPRERANGWRSLSNAQR